jgi:hypothetical protein
MPNAPWRIATADGDVRAGYADDEGAVLLYDVEWNSFCEIRWGVVEETYLLVPPLDENHADAYFLYRETIFLGPDPGSSEYAAALLRNLGYRGDEPEMRSMFAADYGSEDLELLEEVHSTGRPKTLA